MSSSTSILSKTLQSITVTKIRELEKQRAQYETRKNKILEDVEDHIDRGERISCLLHGVKELYRTKDDNENEKSINNIINLLAQSRYDASLPAHMLQSCEDFLRSKLEVESRKLSMAHLYSRLVTEWMDPGDPMEDASVAASSEEDSSFEVIDRQKERLQNLCDQFEKVVFTPLETDEKDINEYLSGFFDTDEKRTALKNLQDHVRLSSESMLEMAKPFNETTLKQCINGLEKDLLSDEKQAILREFEENDVVLREIADVLNTRFADFEIWEWDAGEDGVPVLPRQQLNGKYRIWMDEDVLQAIFIHYIGVRSCADLKKGLTDLVSLSGNRQVWRWHAGPSLTERDAQRRAYYLDESLSESYSGYSSSFRGRGGARGGTRGGARFGAKTRKRGASLNAPIRTDLSGTVAALRKEDYIEHFFAAALPSSINTLNNGMYTEEGESRKDDDSEGAPEDDWGTPIKKKRNTTNTNIKQFLLRTLATEVMVQQALHGKAAVIQSDLKWFGASLSHTSIFAVMRFFGFPENVISFYRKVLEAPLNLSPSSDSPSASGPRTRRRGVPLARAPEKLIGELILFAMDFVVNQETGLQLYRLHDDLWIAGDPSHTAKAWSVMQRFAQVMGLEFNTNKTGSVYLTDEGVPRDKVLAAQFPEGAVNVGHLVLDPKSGKWVINQESVAEHISQLRKQLAESRSVLEWVRTWNSCIGRFFSHTFGEPAFCFGKEHVESILETYRKMQRDIFEPWCKSDDGDSTSGSVDNKHNVVHYLKSKLEARFGVSDISDAFIFFPDQLGGLGLRNPFIPFLLIQDDLCKEGYSPTEIMERCFKDEREEYELKKKEFYSISSIEEREERATFRLGRFDAGEVLNSMEAEIFFSFEEWAASREVTSEKLRDAYKDLQATPTQKRQPANFEVVDFLNDLGIEEGTMFSEVRWLVQIYDKEVKERFDGRRLVDERFLPLGVISMMRKKAVRWGMVL